MATPVPQRDDVQHWTVEQVAAWLQQVELSECCDIFLRKGIDGHKFLQLSEEDLFHWGRDVSIRNCRQILRLICQIKSQQQHAFPNRTIIESVRYLGSQSHKTGSDSVKDFSSGEEETLDHAGIQKEVLSKGDMQGEESIDDMYLVPLRASPTATHASIQNREHSGNHQHSNQAPPSSISSPISQQHGGVPRKQLPVKKEGISNGKSHVPPIPDRLPPRPPPPLPRDDLDSSQNSLHPEKNDHVYEIVDAPQQSYADSEALGPNISDNNQTPFRPPVPPPRNHIQNIDEHCLTSRLGSTSLSHDKRPAAPLPLPTRSQSDGQNGSLTQSPPELPSRINKCKKSKAQSSKESSLPSINLGNGECIELIPLYQTIMEKPYFQFVSRSKAKELVLQGGEGTFLIRPSTRTDKPLTLTVKHDDRSYNINIRQRADTLFALGKEKIPERTFSSIDEIVYAYYKEPITLENGKCALLKYSPSKPCNRIYVRHIPPSP